jgi:hypothetical protein
MGSAGKPPTSPSLIGNVKRGAGDRVIVHNSGWSLWRWVCLRSAGFPIDDCLSIADRECVEMADRVLGAVPGDDEEFAHPMGVQPDSRVRSTATGVAAIRKSTTGDFHNFAEAFEMRRRSSSSLKGSLVVNERFQKAVLWQNREAFRRMREILQDGHVPAWRRRQKELLAARYIQRYCTKNDSIGFFGPIRWFQIGSGGPRITIQAGRDLIDASHVYFEAWAIDALAARIAMDPAIRPWLLPRRSPHIYFDERHERAYDPYIGWRQLDDCSAALLRACDGRRPAGWVVDEVHAGFPSLSYEDLFGRLDDLRQRGMVNWTIEVPWTVRPEVWLAEALMAIPDTAVQARALRPLRALEDGRQAVAVADTIDELDLALGALDATFTEFTGIAPRQHDGSSRSGRNVLYQDCRRSLDVVIDAELISGVAPALGLLLKSARWFTFEVARQYRDLLTHIYYQQRSKLSGQQVSFATLWERAHQDIFQGDARPLDMVLGSFREKWAKILNLADPTGPMRYDSTGLEQAVGSTFDAPHAGWSLARYCSPDILIGAASLDAIASGDCDFVLGELHVGGNTAAVSCLIEQHPRPDDIRNALREDLPAPRVVMAYPKHWPRITARTHPVLLTAKDYLLSFAPTSAAAQGPCRPLSIGELVVEERGTGRIVVETRDRTLTLDLIEVFGELLSAAVLATFRFEYPAYTRRVSIDRLVVLRESWTFFVERLEFAWEKQEASRFLFARRFMRMNGMPQYVFVRSSLDPKPFFVNFSSPIYVELLAKTVRDLGAKRGMQSTLTITEMLPIPDSVWLPDSQGRRYSSEFRFVALDMTPIP